MALDPLISAAAAALIPIVFSSLNSSVKETFALARRRSQFRTVVLKALELDAEAHGQSLEHIATVAASESSNDVDALLPNGLGDLPGRIGVELWLPSSNADTAESLLERVKRGSVKVHARKDLDSLLFIYSATVGSSGQSELDDYLEGCGETIYVWGPEGVAALIQRHQEEIRDLLPELTLAPIRADLNRPEPDWKAQSDERLNRLAGIYRREGVVLALGAGVSIGMGIPNWDELVSGLFVSLVTQQLTDSVDEEQAVELAQAVRSMGNESPLLSARYLRKGFEDGNAGDPRAFQQALSAALYGHSSGSGMPSPLLRELAKLCMPLRTGAKVHSVITYNFDDLLEQELTSEGINHRSIYTARQHPSETELPVFHVHGFLPQDVEKFDGLEDGLLAFSEEGYHQLFKDPYHWTNVSQLQAFQQHICLFAGLSLTDPNLRRLLEYAAVSHDDPRHFVFMKRASVKDLLAESGKLNGGNPAIKADAARDFLRVHHGLQERIYSELGLEVIWFDDYGQMPAAVARLRGR
jgi:hypothetical protein